MAENQFLAACAEIVEVINSKRRKNRTVWTWEWIQNREEKGAYHQLLQELRLTDTSSYSNFLRMDIQRFDKLLLTVAPLIKRQTQFTKSNTSRRKTCPNASLFSNR